MSANETAPVRRDASYDSGAAIWAGDEMLVLSPSPRPLQVLHLSDLDATVVDVSAYDPKTDTWRLATSVPISGFYLAAAAWDGGGLIVWGEHAEHGSLLRGGQGARWDPVTNTWTTIANDAAPRARMDVAEGWTGAEMLVWGGMPMFLFGESELQDGGAYDPAADQWVEIPAEGGPGRRLNTLSAWTGREFLVWGGTRAYGNRYSNMWMNDGAAFNPNTGRWRPLPPAPLLGRIHGAAVWTGDRLVVFGGGTPSGSYNTIDQIQPANDGAYYEPAR
jgi:hypothetical protein